MMMMMMPMITMTTMTFMIMIMLIMMIMITFILTQMQQKDNENDDDFVIMMSQNHITVKSLSNIYSSTELQIKETVQKKLRFILASV